MGFKGEAPIVFPLKRGDDRVPIGGVALLGVLEVFLGVGVAFVGVALVGVALLGVFFAVGVALVGVALLGVFLAVGVALVGVALLGVFLAVGVAFVGMALVGVALEGVAGCCLNGDFEGTGTFSIINLSFFTGPWRDT